ncbi:FMN-dependent NADH-azoreductase [Sphingomonas gei]|uniref:FMN dependent NADH:quinone oxidoreductase n=2 Tax=Sphingomonas gei TaxID=1395960 RepID=A0A4S1X9Q4_9SPHN|nr:FMN-dependent NADH-azoreductase [Sphingomonas gei]
MVRLLYVSASPRKAASASIAAADIFFAALEETGGEILVDELDLWRAHLPEFDGARIAAKYAKLAGREPSGAEAGAWQQMRTLVSRFAAADAVVVATPMWNFGIPYKLKQWIDLITQPGLTFAFDPDTGYSPIIRPRPAFVIMSSAGDYSKGPSFGRPDLATPYLEAALPFLGLGPISIEKIGPTAGPPEVTSSANALAIARLKTCAAEFLGQAS